MEDKPKTTFFSLPIELRLQIAKYALEEKERIGNPGSQGFYTNSAARNLRILLVCRQFQHDFTDLAYQSTTFTLPQSKLQSIHRLPDEKLRNLRKIVIDCEWSELATWQGYAFNKGCMRLDELCMREIGPRGDNIGSIIRFLRHLKNVEKVKYFPSFGNPHIIYGQLVGAMYKDDHFHRYDAPDAPNIGATWWEPQFSDDWSFVFTPREPEPAMAEEEYMVMMKPKVEEIMEWTASHTLLSLSGNGSFVI
jgi:hypothetical protein